MKYTEIQLKEAIKDSLSIRQVLSRLDIIEAGGNYKTIKAKIKELNIDISHFTGRGWNVGARYNNPKIKGDLSIIKNTNWLKKRLILEGYKEAKCDICKLTEWLNKPISLELHHIDGNNSNNNLENIQILCPNCHAQTDNYRGKNIKASLV